MADEGCISEGWGRGTIAFVVIPITSTMQKTSTKPSIHHTSHLPSRELQLVPEPPHDRLHPALVAHEPEPACIRVVEPRRPRLHHARARLVRLKADERQRGGACDSRERVELLAHGRGEAREADDARVRKEGGCRHRARVHEVPHRRLGRCDPEREGERGGGGLGADGAGAGQALERLADDAWVRTRVDGNGNEDRMGMGIAMGRGWEVADGDARGLNVEIRRGQLEGGLQGR